MKKCKRLFASLIILAGLLCSGAGLYFGALFIFSGEILLQVGSAESLVVRATEASPPPDAWTDATRDALPFENQDTAGILPDIGRYDAVLLPFSFRWLEMAKVQSPVLEFSIQDDQGESQYLLDGSNSPKTDLDGLELGELYSWPYLQPHHTGTPMAMVHCRPAGSGIDTKPSILFLKERRWLVSDSLPSVYFVFHDGDVEFPSKLQWQDGARWSVQDDMVVHESDSIVPGEGWTLSNGDNVELNVVIEDILGRPAIVVFYETALGEVEELRIRANLKVPIHNIRFDAPAADENALYLLVDSDGNPHMATYTFLAPDVQASPQAGTWWSPPGGQWEYRFEEAVSRAVAVKPGESKRWALEFCYNNVDLRIVEGESHQIGDLVFHLQRPVSADDIFEVEVGHRGQQAQSSSQLSIGDNMQYQGWHFTVASASDASAGRLILSASRGVQWKWVIPGLLLSFLGVTLLVKRKHNG